MVTEYSTFIIIKIALRRHLAINFCRYTVRYSPYMCVCGAFCIQTAYSFSLPEEERFKRKHAGDLNHKIMQYTFINCQFIWLQSYTLSLTSPSTAFLILSFSQR